MTFDELQGLLIQAEEAKDKGNITKADELTKEMMEAVNVSQYRFGGTPGNDYEEQVLLVKVILHLYTYLDRISNWTAALVYLEKAHTIVDKNNISDYKAKVRSCLGVANLRLSNYPEALEYIRQALAIYEEKGDKVGTARQLGHAGVICAEHHNYNEALEYYERAFALCEILGDKKGIARILGNKGYVFAAIGDYTRALDYYQKALVRDEELGDLEGVARHIGNMGIVFSRLDDTTTALEYYHKALALTEKLENKSGIITWNTNIANIYLKRKDGLTPLEYYSKALMLAEEIGNNKFVAKVAENIGSTYVLLEDYDSAFEYYNKALYNFEKRADKDGIMHTKRSLGELYYNTDWDGYDEAKSEEYLKEAIAINEELGTRLFTAHQSLSKLYQKQNRPVEALVHFQKFYEMEKEVKSNDAINNAQFLEHRRKIEEAERDRQIKLARFQEQEKILHNILPAQIADRIVAGEQIIADSFESVSIFFMDIVGFTELSQRVTAEELVSMLNNLFSQFDQIARKHGLEKIKTIGDSYMAVAGAPMLQENHAERAALFALEIIETMKTYRTVSGEKVEMRIGLHSGAVVAGIIGENKFAYDLWGDAVNTASRMERYGETGKINVSEDFMKLIQDNNFSFLERGEMEIKGKGKMKTYFLEEI